MSDIHALEGSDDGTRYRLVFHIPIPDIPNDAGVSFRTAIAQDPTIDRQSVVPSLNPAEQTQLNNGALVERVVEFTTHPDHSTGEVARIDALYTATSAAVADEVQHRYRYFGFARDLP